MVKIGEFAQGSCIQRCILYIRSGFTGVSTLRSKAKGEYVLTTVTGQRLHLSSLLHPKYQPSSLSP